MGLINTISLLFLLTGGAHAFVYSCQEVKYKLVNTNFSVSARYACLVADENFVDLHGIDALKTIYAQSDNVSTSFADVLSATCVERPARGSWKIVADLPVNLDCTPYETGFSLIFTSSLPKINRVPLGRSEPSLIIGEQLFVEPSTQMWIQVVQCSGTGSISVFTGAGTGEEENRYHLKTWRCVDIPNWIISMENVITIFVDEGVQLQLMPLFHNSGEDIDDVPLDRVAIIASGRSDNLQKLNPGNNHVQFDTHKEEQVTAECTTCSFDEQSDAFLRLTAYEYDGQYHNTSSIIIETEGTSEINVPRFLKVEYIANAIAAEDIWEDQDTFVLELSFGRVFEEIDPYCGCGLDDKFGMPLGWESTNIWLDIVIILDTSEAMGEDSLVDAIDLIESLIGSDDNDVLITNTDAKFYTRVGLIAMYDEAEVIYNLNMTKNDRVHNKVHIKKGLVEINVVDAYGAARTMIDDAKPYRYNTRAVIYYMTDSVPKTDISPANLFKASNGIIIVNQFIKNGEMGGAGLKELASDGFYYTDIQDNYMDSIQLFCKANCFCRTDRVSYSGWNPDPAVKASGGCFHAEPVGVPFSKAKVNCDDLGGGLVASVHDPSKAQFVKQVLSTASPKANYFWIGYTKSGADWSWEDQSSEPYTNWDTDEPSTAAVAKCAYVDMTSPALYWGAGNCNVGFPSVCEFSPCYVGNNDC